MSPMMINEAISHSSNVGIRNLRLRSDLQNKNTSMLQ